jgi:hypothetical protein
VSAPGVCASCGAAILWVTTGTGRRMPLDPELLTILLTVRGKGTKADQRTITTDDGATVSGVLEGSVTATEAEGLLPGSIPRASGRVSHFATCPHAGEHRGRPRG